MIDSDLSELETIEPQRPAPRVEENPWQLLRPRRRRTIFYVWGYDRPHNVGVGPQFEDTDTARCFAARRGWDARQPGAWARECLLTLPLSAAIGRHADTFRLDAAVVGWGLLTVDAD